MLTIDYLRKTLLQSEALGGRVDCAYECYILKKHVYLFLLDTVITEKNYLRILRGIANDVNVRHKDRFSLLKSIIIMARTTCTVKECRAIRGWGRYNTYPLPKSQSWNTGYTFYLINEEKQTYHRLLLDIYLYVRRQIKAIDRAVQEYLLLAKQNPPDQF